MPLRVRAIFDETDVRSCQLRKISPTSLLRDRYSMRDCPAPRAFLHRASRSLLTTPAGREQIVVGEAVPTEQ
jgi:hypothetical protein